MRRPLLPVVLGVLVPIAADSQNALTVGQAELHATFRSIGVTIPFTGDDNGNAANLVEYRETGSPLWNQGHPLSRIDDTWFIGSIVLVDAGTTYEVRVTFSDPEGVSGSPVSASASTRAEGLGSPSGADWYVAPNGDDTGPGTPEVPFQTLEHALETASPGDAIHLVEGTYYQSGGVSYHGSLAGDPIFVMADGDSVIFSGADSSLISNPAAWSSLGQGVYAVDLSYRPKFVAVGGAQTYHYDTEQDFWANTHNLNGSWFQGASDTLFVRYPLGTAPASSATHIGQLVHALHLYYCENIVLDGLCFEYYGSGDYPKGLYVDGSKKVTIRNCRFFNNNLPIWVKREANDCLFEGNYFENTSHYGWRWSIQKGSIHENSAIYFSGGFTGRRNVVRDNRIVCFFDGVGLGGDVGVGHTLETDFHDNVLSRLPDDCIETDGTSSNIRIWGNVFTDFHMGISVAPGDMGPTYVFRNLFYDFGNTLTNTVNGYPASQVKLNHGYATVTGPMFFYHNTSCGPYPEISALLLKTPGTWDMLTCRNNIWLGTYYAFENWDGSRPCDLDYDCMHTTGAYAYARVDGTTYQTFADFQAGTGQEAHGWDLLPDFVDSADGDFRLSPGCPLIDQGDPIPGFNHGFLGSGPDPGALESGAGGPPAIIGLRLRKDGSDLVLEWSPLTRATYNVYAGTLAYAIPDSLLQMGWPSTSYRMVGEAALPGAAFYDVRAFLSGLEGPPSPDRVGRFVFPLVRPSSP
jgi:parallel beta-helix repeat protein